MHSTANAWEPSTVHPGYRCKTLQVGACTVQILRPEIEEGERQKREVHTQAVLERTLSDYYKRKEAKQ